MKQLFYMCCISVLVMSFGVTANAQDKTESSKNSERAKAEKQAPDSDKAAKEQNIDLDAFFKKGEENAKTSNCSKPAKPADPIA